MTTTRKPVDEISSNFRDCAFHVNRNKPSKPVRFVAYDKTGQCKPFGLVSLREIWKLEYLEWMARSNNVERIEIAKMFEDNADSRARSRGARNRREPTSKNWSSGLKESNS